mmetsp:Transcript_176386/g.560256  ORF Transcript_176386/g.560256 Transcript_176386/m.560256 type:complete len:281 (+) Transcript_176386:174-1016(+)
MCEPPPPSSALDPCSVLRRQLVSVQRRTGALRDDEPLLVGGEAEAGDLGAGASNLIRHLAILAEHDDAAVRHVMREVEVRNIEVARAVHCDRRGAKATGELVEHAAMEDLRWVLCEAQDTVHGGLADIEVLLVGRQRHTTWLGQRVEAEGDQQLGLRADGEHRAPRVLQRGLPEGTAVCKVEHAGLPGQAQRIRPQELRLLVLPDVGFDLLPRRTILALDAENPENGLVSRIADESHTLVVELQAQRLSGGVAPLLCRELVVVVHASRVPENVTRMGDRE